MAIFNALNNQFAGDYNGLNKVSKNKLIAANFGTNPWQRGTSFTAIANNSYCADRFFVAYNSTAVTNITKSTTVPTVTQANFFSVNSLQMAVTTLEASIGAGEYYLIGQRIEGYNFSAIAQRAFTISFWVYAFQAGTYCVALVNSGGDRSYVAEYTISNSNTWQKITINVPASPSAGTWDYTTGIGLSVYFTQACGSTFQTTAGAWNTGLFYGTSNQVNNLSSTSNTFLIDLIQIESGIYATPFEQKSFQEILADCQRYYQKTFPQATAPANAAGTQNGALQYRVSTGGVFNSGQIWQYPETMRIAPTPTFYNPVNNNSNWYNSSGAADSGVSGSANVGDSALYATNPQVAGDAAGQIINVHCALSAEL